jgi:DNA polymerase-3 subunit beta
MNATGNELTLATTDLEVSAQLRLEVQVQQEGIALVPARLLADMVKSFEAAPVEFEAEEGQARIVCSNYQGTVRCLPAEDFPMLQEPSGSRVVVATDGFALGVSQVSRAASRDEARPILTGVLLEITPEGLTMVATDSYRLSMRELTATAAGEAKALVPERALTEAGRAAGADGGKEIELFVDASSVAFRIGTLTLTSRLIEGEFPNYRQLLPELEAAERIGSARYEDPVGRVTTDHGCGCCPFRRGLASDDRRHPNRDKYVGKHDT